GNLTAGTKVSTSTPDNPNTLSRGDSTNDERSGRTCHRSCSGECSRLTGELRCLPGAPTNGLAGVDAALSHSRQWCVIEVAAELLAPLDSSNLASLLLVGTCVCVGAP